MTFRAIWGEPFPEWADHPTEEDAHRFALRVSREQGVEVAVVEIPGPPGWSGAPGSAKAARSANGAESGAERTTGA